MRQQRSGSGLRATFPTERRRIAGLAATSTICAVCASGIAANAATATKVFHASATVIASCNIQPVHHAGVAKDDIGCTRADSASIAPPQPLVTFTTNDVTGVVRETIAF